MKIGRYLFPVLVAVLLTGCAARLPEDELHLARVRLDKSLDYVSTQSEMNIISVNIFALAQMERHWIEYRICNQPGYDKIEKAFREDCDEWDRTAARKLGYRHAVSPHSDGESAHRE